jgi:hypothetical protein
MLVPQERKSREIHTPGGIGGLVDTDEAMTELEHVVSNTKKMSERQDKVYK